MRFLQMDDAMFEYLGRHANPSYDPVGERLAATTRERFPDDAGMNIGADQGHFLAMLVAITGARTVVEIGTFTGMSALWLARALPTDGHLVCFDLNETYRATAEAAWAEAGVADRIEMHIGPAADGLADWLASDPARRVDLAFLDADKTGYSGYVDQLLPRLSDRGVIVVDNVLWSGRVVTDEAQDDYSIALRAFNDEIATRDDVAAVMLPVGDGVTMIRRV